MNWTLVIHGGCGAMQPDKLPPEQEERARAGLAAALDAGGAILAAGGSSLDAVEAAARVLEEDTAFNAGRGSVLTAQGHAELDAAIMDGRDRRAGAVAGLRTTRAPVSAARAAMEHSPHVLLTYDQADRFAEAQGLEQVTNDWFIIPERRAQLEAVMASGGKVDTEMKYGTIGAVAGHELAARMRLSDETLQQALDAVLADVVSLGGTGGLIAVAPSGEAAWGFTTPGMYRARATAGAREIAVYSEPARR